MSEKLISFQQGWSDCKPAKTFLIFAAGLTLGISLTVLLLEKESLSSRHNAAATVGGVPIEKTVPIRK